MILADTSIWVDHFRTGDKVLAELLDTGNVLMHPFVTGELALGNLRHRNLILSTLQDLPRANVATEAEMLHFISRYALFGLGIGYVDAHLLAAVRLTAGATLWTRDGRLHRVAEQLAFERARALTARACRNHLAALCRDRARLPRSSAGTSCTAMTRISKPPVARFCAQ